jgi:hypothetical protein
MLQLPVARACQSLDAARGVLRFADVLGRTLQGDGLMSAFHPSRTLGQRVR